jgi:hypothetical protein
MSKCGTKNSAEPSSVNCGEKLSNEHQSWTKMRDGNVLKLINERDQDRGPFIMVVKRMESPNHSAESLGDRHTKRATSEENLVTNRFTASLNRALSLQ